MPLQKIGLNVSALGNITPPVYDLPNSTSSFFDSLPEKANELTNGYFGISILVTVFFYMFWRLSDKSQFSDFGYSKLRAAGISSGVCAVTGILMLNIGYFTNLYHVVLFIITFLIISIWIAKAEK